MRTLGLMLLVVASAALGGGAATLLERDGDGATTTVRQTVVVSSQRGDAAAATAAPAGTSGFDPARIFADRADGVVTLYAFFGSDGSSAGVSQGSGFIVSADGYVLTNSHVITNAGEGGTPRPASQVYVEFSDGDRVVGEIVGWDIFDDVGLVKVDPADHALAPVPLGDSSKVVVGEPVAAIGSPFGNENSLAVGVVSATKRSIESLTSRYDLPDAIQTDAPINHGNSGGPLFDAAGRVIGINAQIRSQSGRNEGVGFAIPINAAKRSMRQLKETGRVAYSYVGIRTESLTPSIAREFDYGVERGAIVVDVAAGSPAARAELRGGTGQEFFRGQEVTRGGDVIVAIDGIPVRAADDVIRIASSRLEPGRTAVFTIVRGDERRQVRVTLDERPPTPAS